MTIEIVSFPMKNKVIFHSYVTVYQRVTILKNDGVKVNGVGDDIPFFLEMENKIHVWNHQPDLFWPRHLDIWPIKSEDCQEKRMIKLVSRSKHEDIYQQEWDLPTEMWSFPNITGIQNNINEDSISTNVASTC